MVQGDAYYIPVGIKLGGTLITNSNCDGVKIKIGSVTKSTINSVVTYDSTTQKWNFPITQTESLTLTPDSQIEVQVKVQNDIFSSEPQQVDVTMGIIKEAWNGSNN